MRAKKKLEEKGFIKTFVKKHNGDPVLHYSLNTEKLSVAITECTSALVAIRKSLSSKIKLTESAKIELTESLKIELSNNTSITPSITASIIKKHIHTTKPEKENKTEEQPDPGVCDQINPEREEENHTLSAPEKKENQSEQKQQCYDESNQGTKRRVKGTGHTSSNTKNEFSDDFLNFYSSYPKKISKGDAWKAWKQVSKQLPQIDELLAILEKHKAQEGWKNHQYIPYPASWLRGLRWQDDVATVRVQQDLFGVHSKLQQDKGSLHDQLLNKAKESKGKNG
jgi:hypothetical protein